MMSKNSKRKILTAAVLCAYTTMWANPAWARVHGNDSNGQVTIDNEKTFAEDICGWYKEDGDAVGGKVTIEAEIKTNRGIYGGYSSKGNSSKNIVEINNSGSLDGSKYEGIYLTYGGYSKVNGSVIENKVIVNKGAFRSKIYGGYSYGGYVDGNIVQLKLAELDSGVDVIGGHSRNKAAEKNNITVSNNIVEVYEGTNQRGIGNEIVGGRIDNKNTKDNLTMQVKSNKVIIYGGTVNNVVGGKASRGDTIENRVEVYGGQVLRNIVGGNSFNTPNGSAIGNTVLLAGGQIGSENTTSNVYGGTSGTEIGDVKDNKIILQNNVNVANANLFGYGTGDNGGRIHTGNELVIDGWIGKDVNSVQNFNAITFKNIEWSNSGVVLNITNAQNDVSLKDTEVNLKNFTLNSENIVQVGDKMTFIQSNLDTGLSLDNINEDVTFSQGVAKVGKLEMKLEGETNNLIGEITGVSLNNQTKLVAENRAVAAAFINQGTDLIADSLDTISRDGKYGIKTFAAVHGNRSKYDVNSDIKINGWSTIVGVGSENEHNGGDFSWGVFYENGSGNYRTYNEFNNEFFRGDGSLVYNGGGIAARYENAHGVYTEGSLRAGMLKSEMTDALSDGKQKYGYKSESEYYGAHIGIGQIIPLTESSDLDVYGKFFHTYTEGDSFNVAGDEFEFDSINSDRLRIGARLTTNKENKFSTYYGLAYEYEFNGDAEMRAAGMDAPTQSLQGSSYMAEIGLNYQPTPDSPWSFDLNMRGYAGEREGATFNVQATYTF